MGIHGILLCDTLNGPSRCAGVRARTSHGSREPLSLSDVAQQGVSFSPICARPLCGGAGAACSTKIVPRGPRGRPDQSSLSNRSTMRVAQLTADKEPGTAWRGVPRDGRGGSRPRAAPDHDAIVFAGRVSMAAAVDTSALHEGQRLGSSESCGRWANGAVTRELEGPQATAHDRDRAHAPIRLNHGTWISRVPRSWARWRLDRCHTPARSGG